MKEKIIYECDFCGYQDERKEFIEYHEKCCALNPANQPCSLCSNMLVGLGCLKGMNPDLIGGKVKCFFYKEGMPQFPPIEFLKKDEENSQKEEKDD